MTALAGALAAAMGEMVLNYSVGKRGLEAHQAELRAALAELHRARRVMIELMAEDQSAYQALSTARKLPSDSADWRGQFPAALLASIRTPEAIAATALAVLELCDRVCDFVDLFLRHVLFLPGIGFARLAAQSSVRPFGSMLNQMIETR